MRKKKITLAIETAVGGGSLSLLEDISVIDCWVGEREVSRSEELIEAVSAILTRNQIKSGDLDMLAASRGPGSYTGARIGLATAIGLKNGLDIKCFGASVLDSFYYKFGNQNLDVITAVSFGKKEVCYQLFKKFHSKNENEEISPEIITFEKFVKCFNCNLDKMFVLNQKLYVEAKDYLSDDYSKNKINAGVVLSDFIGQFVINDNGSDNLSPIYSYINGQI
jgi:tRNA threonylcarbamoyl adenosine modification protein YeaZ